MKNNKITVKIFSILLSVLIISNILPMQVFAEEVTSLNQVNTVIGETAETETTETVEAEREILSEEASKREEYVKHFRMSDGTYQAVQYETPVHFEKNNEWVEYDNTLEETEASAEENEGKIIKNKDYINKLADFSVRFSKKTNGHKFVRYEKDGYELSWYYEDAKKKYAEVIEVEDDGDETTLEKNSSQVVYKGVFKDTDLQYIVNAEGVKENIVLNSDKSPTEYVSQYKVNGLTPVQLDDKTIELQNEKDEAIYIISAPYMIDGNGVTSHSLSIKLSGVKNNKFTVTLTLDSSWLQEEARAYPVIADPAIVTSQAWDGEDSCESAYISSSMPTTRFGDVINFTQEGSMYVGKTINRGKTRALIKCKTLPELSVADKVVSAEMAAFVNASFSVNSSLNNSVLVTVHKVNTAWSQNTVCWNSNGNTEISEVEYDTTVTDYQLIPWINNYDVNVQRWFTFDITELVQDWYKDESSNNGVLLHSVCEDYTDQSRVWFFSNNYPDYYQARPLLRVTYRNMSGYEDYYSYTSLSSGRGGTASVNNYNGNLVFTQPLTLDTGCNIMPVNLSLVYNNNGDATPFGFMGNRVQTNFHIYLRYDEALAGNGFRYYLHDADGTKHWFYFENDSNVGKDEDGLGYTLEYLDKTVAPYAEFLITDKNKNKMYFDEWGWLLKIENSNNVAITLEYETFEDCFRIKSITDGIGRKYLFGYHEYYHNSIINFTDPVGRVTYIYTDGNNNLSSVCFPDGKSIYLNYGSNGLLSEIYDIDGNKTAISYHNSVQKQVYEFAWGKPENVLDYYNFIYKQNATEITDSQGRKFTYQFNDWGQNTAIVSNENGNAQFFKYNNSSDEAANAKNSSRNKVLSSSKVINSVSNYVINSGFQRDFWGYWSWNKNTNYPTVYSVVNDIGCLTKKALKISKESWNTYESLSAQTITGLKSGWYTASCYVNTFGETLGGDGLIFGYQVWGFPYGEYPEVSGNCEKVIKTDGWERLEVSFYVPADKELRIVFGYGANSYGTFYLDDLQLEEGDQGASSYNIVENVITEQHQYQHQWLTDGKTLTPTNPLILTENDPLLVNIPGYDKFFSIPGGITDQYRRVLQDLSVSGKAGDVYSFGSWLYGESVPTDRDRTGNLNPCFEMKIHYYDVWGTWIDAVVVKANPDCVGQWQFVSSEAIIPVDYSKLSFEICYNNNANNIWFTKPFCYREQFGQSYTYDNEGNVVSAKDLANANSSFAYQDNNLVNAINPSGSAFLYRYDETNNNLLCADSTNGVRYTFDYDAYGNATAAMVKEMKLATYLEYNVTYNIRNKHSGNAMDMCGENGNVHNYGYGYDNTNQEWTLESAGEEGVYYLKANNKYLYVDGSSGEDGAYFKTAQTNTGDDKFKFKIDGNGNGTWSIKSKTSNYSKCVDGMPGDTNDCSNCTPITQQAYVYGNAGQEWYFYIKYSDVGKKVIYTSAEYIRNGNYLYKQTDQLGNVTRYNYDQLAGRLYSVTDAKGNTTKYTYNNDTNQLLSVSSGGMTNYYAYENDRLTFINSNNSVGYKFTYDNFGRTLKNEVGNGTEFRTLSTMYYDKHLLIGQAYGNGDYINYSYDNLDRLTEIKYNDNENKKKTYIYGTDGNVSSVLDTASNTRTKYVYDLSGRLVETKEYSGTNLSGNQIISNTEYFYQDKTNYLTWMNHNSTLGNLAVAFDYGILANGQMPDQVYNVWWNGTTHLSRSFDGLGRLSSSVINNTLTTNYYYKDISDTQTTTQLQSMVTPAGTFTYTYDSLGNITSIVTANSEGTFTSTYEYDALNQLVRENDQKNNVTYTYEYLNGNILSKKQYAYTTGELGAVVNTINYGYGDSVWKDLLTSYNGMNITYDNIGNMTSFNGRTYSWLGRQLQSISGLATYTYNMDGQRIGKITANDDITYYYNGDILAGQKNGNTVTFFMYDENGDYIGFNYAGMNFYYIKNAQNDVIAIADSSGTVVTRYTYDSWGKLLSMTGNVIFGTVNPIRYRSYYYDNESGLYYLQSRYYNPEIGRFICADGVYDTNQGILGYNMYVYCLNNPVNMYDPDGRCSRFLGFLWKIDCKQASCSKSKNYVKPKAIDPVGSYNKGQGYVYVVTEDQLDIMEEKEENVVVIVDKRTEPDPNMQIQESYKITKTKQQKEIAQLMLDYNTANPVSPMWNRTLDSLVKEWEIHNNVYKTGLFQSNTADCDFNNGDEGQGYWDFFVERVLK